jgi:hypothetical protein
MSKTLLMALCICMASPVQAEEVLYCVDMDATGFLWDKDNHASQRNFKLERHTIKVMSDTERLIQRMEGDTAGKTRRYKCRRTYGPPESTACDDGLGDNPWVFYQTTYVRAFLAGPPAGGWDSNITVAYGTCTKF